MFESVDTHPHTHTDTRTPARILSYELTSELKRIKKLTVCDNFTFQNIGFQQWIPPRFTIPVYFHRLPGTHERFPSFCFGE